MPIAVFRIMDRHIAAGRGAAVVFVSVIVCGACSNADFPTVALADGSKQVLAPIEAAEIVVRQTSPRSYAVRITSGLPSGCATFDRIDHIQNGSVVELKVWNTLPANEKIACTMVYGNANNTVDLGNAFEPGRTYDVRINGETKVTFTAQ
jgi:hypothetical protein